MRPNGKLPVSLVKKLSEPVTVTRGVLAWAIFAIVMSTLAVSIFSVVYANQVQRTAESRAQEQRRLADHRWCAMFALIDIPVSPQIDDPEQRARSQRLVSKIHQLRIEHGCIPS